MDLFAVVLTIAIVLFRRSTEEQGRVHSSLDVLHCSRNLNYVESIARRWAPLVWLAPGERYFPGSVPQFLHHVTPRRDGDQLTRGVMPEGPSSESWFLVANRSIELLLRDPTSFLHGVNPARTPTPVYAHITTCPRNLADENSLDNDVQATEVAMIPAFHVTYWMFYPYSQGKPVCMVDMGVFGTWPLPGINGYCLGSVREYGSHVGDWEHVTLLFRKNGVPVAMYVSAHDAGAYYRFNAEAQRFEFERQEARAGVLQRPVFPTVANLTSVGTHPVLFAARGSHGLWTKPGRHKYVKVPSLHDHTGYGVPWATWKHVQVIRDSRHNCEAVRKTNPSWMKYRGRWGNPKNKCHPVVRLGLNICEYSDGPTGIPMKRLNFKCSDL